jgi:5'-3' exonuclease
MGVKGLKQFLLAKFPQALARFHLSHLSGKKVAVDILTPLYKYKAAMGENWLTGILSFLLLFPRYNVHATVFADGPCVPIEKKEEQQKRSSARDKIKDKVADITRALEKFKSTGEVDDILTTLPIEASSQKSLLLGTPAVDVDLVEMYLEKIKKQVVHISSEDMNKVAMVCRALEISFYVAREEAESMCSWLCLSGQVDAVVTEDSDVLAYGTPMWISDLDFQGNCLRIQLEDILREMNFTREQLVDFCILCGTDFNHRVDKLGPVTAFGLLQKFQTIEGVCREKKITGEELNTQAVRRIFSNPCQRAVRSRKDTTERKVVIRFNRVPEERKLLSRLRELRLPMRYAQEFLESVEDRVEFE